MEIYGVNLGIQSKYGKIRTKKTLEQVRINFFINSAQFSELNPQDYDQKRKLFRTNSFVLAHSSAKKIYNEELTLKSTIQWYHMTEYDVI